METRKRVGVNFSICLALFFMLSFPPISKAQQVPQRGSPVRTQDRKEHLDAASKVSPVLFLTQYFGPKMNRNIRQYAPLLNRASAPVLTGIVPSSGAPGITVRISGAHFSSQGAVQSRLIFEPYGRPRVSENVRVLDDNHIEATIPPGSGSVGLYLDAVGGRSNTIHFNFLPPRITAVRPAYGGPGQVVEIIGSHFGVRRLVNVGSMVMFGESLAQAMSWEDTRIVVQAPSDYGTGTNKNILLGLMSCGVTSGAAGAVTIVLNHTLGGCNGLIHNLLARYSMAERPGFVERRVGILITTAAGRSNDSSYTYRVNVENRGR